MTGDGPPQILALADARVLSLALGGGKAANLCRLMGWGFPVPPGFVVTTAGYDAVVDRNDLQQVIASVSQYDGSAAIRAEFELATIPPDLKRAILAAYRELGGGAVAVRSSATAEDLSEAAFAGQQETLLGINDDVALLAAVRRCWASLWSERAIAYRVHYGMAAVPVKLAVIVHRLVPADAAGVLFTANPITGARDESIVEASAGLGEAVVSGAVTPDQFTLRHSRHRWLIAERRLTGAATMPDDVLLQLARMGASIARRFGQPQDIEWAQANGSLYVLQSRPITALPDPPPRASRFAPPQFAADYLQIRPYPLDVTTWMAAVSAALPRMFPVDGLIPSLDAMLVEDDGIVTRIADFPGFRFSPRLLVAPARFSSLARKHDPAGWRSDPLFIAYGQRVQGLESRDLRGLTWEELLNLAGEALAMPSQLVEVRRRYFPRGALALGALRLLLSTIGMADRFADLLSGVDNMTLQANRALEVLAAEIRGNAGMRRMFADRQPSDLRDALHTSATGRALLQRFDRFLRDYGHRETGSPLLVSQPTWKDTPETVFAILQGLARAEPAVRTEAANWTAARDAVLQHPALRLEMARRSFLRTLNEARRFSALREDTHYAMTMPMPVLRRTLVEMGRRLTGVGALESAEDVFHLRLGELAEIGKAWPPTPERIARLRDVAQRRAEQRAVLESTPLMELAPAHAGEPNGDALVAGAPGSPGTAIGAVRVVPDVAAFRTLLPGEVLVAPYTNPSWTPLFGRAAAVVVDTGGAMSHAAILAREYGLPAVMGTGNATRQLHDGQWVRVDGSRGLVYADSRNGEDAPPGIAVDTDGKHEDGSRGDGLPESRDSIEVEGV